jgi:hypothetical protein
VINGFYFYDVRKSSGKNLNDLPKLTYETKNGLIISLSSVGESKGKESWIKIETNFNDPKSKALSEEINTKTSGFQFLANINTSEILLWDKTNFKAKDL